MRLRRLDHIANDNSFREEVVIYEGDIYPFRPLRRLLFLLIRGLSSPVRPQSGSSIGASIMPGKRLAFAPLLSSF